MLTVIKNWFLLCHRLIAPRAGWDHLIKLKCFSNNHPLLHTVCNYQNLGCILYVHTNIYVYTCIYVHIDGQLDWIYWEFVKFYFSWFCSSVNILHKNNLYILFTVQLTSCIHFSFSFLFIYYEIKNMEWISKYLNPLKKIISVYVAILRGISKVQTVWVISIDMER